MLFVSHISQNKINTEEWRMARLAHFTSSDAVRLMGSKSTFLTYVREKAGEEVSGIPARKEIDTEETRWGLHHEMDALKLFQKVNNLQMLVYQCFITAPGSRFGSTPDSLIPITISPDQKYYIVEPVEAKCPPTYANYIELFECMTPMDLKDASPKYYWQVLDQIDECGAKRGHFIAYHPDFKVGNFKHLEMPLNYKFVSKTSNISFPVNEDYKQLKIQKAEAEKEFNRVRALLIKAGRAA